MAILLILCLIGALSPLLTLAWLWQVKEWRWDRMLEHLRREGWFRQLGGKTRPAVVALYAVTMVIVREDKFLPIVVLIGFLLVLATLTAAHIVFGRQRYPVATKKALTVTGTAGLLTIIVAIFLYRMEWLVLLPVIVLLQPLSLLLAWLLWKPLDAFLKHRVLSTAARARLRHPKLTVIGVTGSVGKTTTKELLSCVLKDLQPLTTPAHVNTEMGVAAWMSKTLSRLPEDSNAVLIVEMGAYKKGEIALLCSFTKPTMGVVTHVGTQHIALFGSQENLQQAKAELVTSLPADGRAFLNGDNALTQNIADWSPCPVTVVGTGGRNDLEAFDITETSRGFRFRATETMFDIPLAGTHNVTNVLLAIAVGEALGVPLPRQAELLRNFSPMSGTFQVREEAGVHLLDDTHNGSAASMKAAIAWARNRPEARKIFLTAGLIEMGELQAPAERELGTLAAQTFERTIVIDPISVGNFAAGGPSVELLSSRSARVEPGTLLVCSGRMSASIINRLLPSVL